MNAGFLKRYYLCCDSDPEQLWEHIMYRTDKFSKSLCSLSEEKQKKHQDAILKMTAAYLLKKGESDREYCPVTIVDAVNWMKDTHKVGELDGKYFYRDEAQEERPFWSKKLLANHKDTMIRIDEGWLAAGGWCVVAEEELEQMLKKSPRMHFWADPGSEEYLKEGERYEIA